MPRGDRTGPMGMGPMTGRGAGFCAGYPVPGFMNPAGGRLGLGLGWGRGIGRGMWWRPAFPYYGAPYPPSYGAFPYRPWGAAYRPPVMPSGYGMPYTCYPYGY